MSFTSETDPLAFYIERPDHSPDRDAHPDKFEAVAAARACGPEAMRLIGWLCDSEIEAAGARAAIDGIHQLPNKLETLKAAKRVASAWQTPVVMVISSNIATMEREAAITELRATVGDPLQVAEGEEVPDSRGRWIVMTEGDWHILRFAGTDRSKLRGHNGLETLERMAAQFNKAGSVPGRQPRVAADVKDPAAFIEARGSQSPLLPLEIHTEPNLTEPMTKQLTGKEQALSKALPDVRWIPARQFERYPANRTIGSEAIKKMSASVREVGVRQPLTARPLPAEEGGEERFQLVIGETRWRGCLAIGEDFLVPVYICDLSDKDASRIHAIENFQRQDLDEIEEAQAILHMRDSGWTLDEIKETIGREKAYVYARLSLLELSEDAHKAIRDKNLSVNTARKIATLPEEVRAEALKAVVNPKVAARALPEREALQLLDREFAEPIKAAADWEKKRKLAEKENPGAVWMEYQEARKAAGYGSPWTEAGGCPSNWSLSDAAKAGELVVPTWGELAKKHGAKIHIGTNHNCEIVLYVHTEPLVAAELAAHDDKPGECIFPHEKAKAIERAAAERRKLEDAAQREAVRGEFRTLIALVLTPGSFSKTIERKTAGILALELADNLSDLHEVFGLRPVEGEGYEAEEERGREAVAKWMKQKEIEPFELLGRMVAAHTVAESGSHYLAPLFLGNGLVKAKDFPELQAIYEQALAEKARQEAARAEYETEKAAKEAAAAADKPKGKKAKATEGAAA